MSQTVATTALPGSQATMADLDTSALRFPRVDRFTFLSQLKFTRHIFASATSPIHRLQKIRYYIFLI